MSKHKPQAANTTDPNPFRSAAVGERAGGFACLVPLVKNAASRTDCIRSSTCYFGVSSGIMLGDGTATASLEHLVSCVNSHLEQSQQFALPQVINATGILLHTGLGRSPLSTSAISAIALASSSYTPLEMDLRSGERGQRVDVVRQQLCDLTGSESATVVNNNAAALLITLSYARRGKRSDCIARRTD